MAYIKFALKDGTPVYIESAELPKGSSGLIPPTKGGDHMAEAAALSFEDAISTVRKMAEALVEQMQDGVTNAPDEMQVNFSLKASSDVGGLVVSRGGMESNFAIMVRWSSPERKKDEEKAAEKAEDKAEDKEESKDEKEKEEVKDEPVKN